MRHTTVLHTALLLLEESSMKANMLVFSFYLSHWM